MTQPTPTISPASTKPDATAGYPSPAKIRITLLSLTFPEYVATVARLLDALGYRNVRPMGSPHEKGRNAFGGMDLCAEQGQGLTSSKVIVQAKRYRDPVPRSFVDEIRGAMIRTGSGQGIIFTTSEFSPAATLAALSGQHAAPVRLVDGSEMVRLMVAHRVELSGAPRLAPVPEPRNKRAGLASALPPGSTLPRNRTLDAGGASLRVVVTLDDFHTDRSLDSQHKP